MEHARPRPAIDRTTTRVAAFAVTGLLSALAWIVVGRLLFRLF